MKKTEEMAVSVRIPTEHVKLLKLEAEKKYLSLSQVVRGLIREWIEKKK